MPLTPIVTLTTGFGLDDWYVAAIKAVLPSQLFQWTAPTRQVNILGEVPYDVHGPSTTRVRRQLPRFGPRAARLRGHRTHAPEVLANIRQAIEEYIADCIDAGDPVPTEEGKELVEIETSV